MTRLEPARLGWRDDQPYATDYGDIYHSPDGLAEVQRVFLQPSGFTERLTTDVPLLVGELGFGTGLNFAVVATACIAARKRLHFVSFDCAPLADTDFQTLARRRQRELPIYRELAAVYPPLIAGWHRRVLAGGLVTLSVYWGTAAAGITTLLEEQRRPFSMWLLDGFAPDRNPDMWAPELLAQLARLSHRGTTVATFTAAGRVRRALADVGFAMRRVDQRPHKRESLAGVLTLPGRPTPSPPAQVSVVGAGIAGASVARHLADAGLKVTVYDATGATPRPRRDPISRASDIPITVMHGRLLANQQPDGLLRAHAFLYASAYSRQFEATGSVQHCTALQVPSANYPLQRLHQVAECYASSGNWLAMVDAATASAEAGLRFDTPMLRFTGAAIIRTPELCRQLLAHPDIELISNSVPDWPATTTVLACGTGCQNFSSAEYLELAGVSGQVDLFRTDNELLQQLPVALVGNGYLATGLGGLVAGATYEYQPWPQARATAANRGYLEAFAATAAGSIEWLQHYRGERCVSSDRTPVAGGLFDESGEPLPGRYVSTGHGSMGTVSAHFCAALIAADIVGDFAPMTAPLRALLSPQRFRRRQHRRGYKFGASN